jgi:hypothetical protein
MTCIHIGADVTQTMRVSSRRKIMSCVIKLFSFILRVHGVISQKAVLFIVTSVRTSNLIHFNFHLFPWIRMWVWITQHNKMSLFMQHVRSKQFLTKSATLVTEITAQKLWHAQIFCYCLFLFNSYGRTTQIFGITGFLDYTIVRTL